MEKAVLQPSIFVLCDSCRWCATYMDKSRARDRCPSCSSSALSSFPVMPDESFTFSYDEKRGIEMDFGRRSSRR
ncbi:MAG: hypothetical protein ACREAI_01730 [Nitrososphaera sp.]|jgi:hypothetical protein